MQFDEMMKNSPKIKQFYFEWEGLRVFGAIDITDVPKELEVKFTSPHPAGDVALRMNAFGCKFAHVDGKLSDRIRLVHGDVNPNFKPGDENYARIPIYGISEKSSILIYNEYLVGSRGIVKNVEFESFTGNSGMLLQRDGDLISFQCNSWKPVDRKKFEDMQGVIKLIY